LFLMVIGLYTSRIIFRGLGAVDYGLYDVVAGLITIFLFVSNSLSTTTNRYLSFELGKGDEGNLKMVFSSSLHIYLRLAIVIFFVSEIIGVILVNKVLNIPSNRLTACNFVFQMSVFSTILGLLRVPFSALIIAHENMKIYAYTSILDGVFKLLVAYSLYISSFDKLITYSICHFLVVLTMSLIYLFYCKKKYAGDIYFSRKVPYRMVKSMLSFTSWGLLGSVAIMLKNYGINFLVNIFFGPTVNAALAIGNMVNSKVTSFSHNFTVALNPQITKSYAAGQNEDMHKLVERGCRFSFFLLTYLTFPIIIELPYILHIWLGDTPEYTFMFVRLVLLLSLVDCFSYSIGCAIQATGVIRNYQFVISGLNLLIFPITFILYAIHCPPFYAIIVSIFISIVNIVARLYFMKFLLSFDIVEFVKRVYLRCFAIAAISFPVCVYVHQLQQYGLMRLIVVTLTVMLVNSIIIYLFGLESTERQFIVSRIKKKIGNA